MKIKLLDFGYKKKPERAHYNDAGLDVFANIEYPTRLYATESDKIPLGFGVEIPDGYVGFICPRSGLSSKGITCELSPIDSGYRGEIHAIVTNNTNMDYLLRPGDKIGQLVILPCIMADLVEAGEFDKAAKRDAGGFGSTGK